MPSKLLASAAQDMTRWKGGVPGTMMLTMKVKGALLTLRARQTSSAPLAASKCNCKCKQDGDLRSCS